MGVNLFTNLSVVSHEYDCSLSGWVSLFVVSGPWCRHCEAVFRVKISSRECACLLRSRLPSVTVPPWPESRSPCLRLRWRGLDAQTVFTSDGTICWLRHPLQGRGHLGGLFCNGAVRTLSLVQIHKVSGTLKGQTWDPWGDKDADRLPSQVPAVRRMVPCDTAILYVSSQEFNYDLI